MLTLFLLASVLGAGTDELAVTRTNDSTQLAWSDTDDRVQGTIRPATPYAGEPFDLSVHVGSFYGAEFDGPVTITFKGPGDTYQSTTVKRTEGNKAWAVQLTGSEPGEFNLELNFATTRHKVVRGVVVVGPGRVPRWPWFVALGAVAAGLLIFGVRSIRKAEAT